MATSLQVQYCNQNGIDFLAYNTGHGSTATLGQFNGVQISLSKLTQVTIEPNGKSAWLQGGTIAGPVNKYLWDNGYVTTTGACDCVGLAGAGLGGGHGLLQGIYGLVSDNIRQFNVVLADGSAIRVNATSHSDLYWALRGAGHNFGIVTSFEMDIYPSGPPTWHYKSYTWTGDNLEDVFTALNNLHGNGTAAINMTYSNGIFMYLPTIKKTEPVMSWFFAFRGSAEDGAPYFAAFDAIPALSVQSGDVPYPELSHIQDSGVDDVTCTSVFDRYITTTGLIVFNITAEQQIFDSFTRRIAEQPSLAELTYIIHESYPGQTTNSADSAYPFRADDHVTQFQGNLPSNSSSQDQDQMQQWAKEVEDLWIVGQPGRPLDAYVNYASGFETVQDWYGHEAWRVAKLQSLKKIYDPSNQFRFYNPVIST